MVEMRNVTLDAGQNAVMFLVPQTISTLSASNQPLTLSFMENLEAFEAPPGGQYELPTWTRVYLNGELQSSGNIHVNNEDRLQLYIDASPAHGFRRTAYLSYGHKQFILDVQTTPLSPPPPSPPPSPPQAPPIPIEISLQAIANRAPRVCSAKEQYEWQHTLAHNRSSLPVNSWCARNLASGSPFTAPLCSTVNGRDILILVDASTNIGRELFYSKVIDMLHDMYCTIEGTGSKVGVLLLPGTGNPYVCDAYSSYIPLNHYTSAEFHARLEQMRADPDACCGKSMPLAQGFKAARAIFEDYGEFNATERSVIVVTGSLPSTSVEAETCLSVSVPEYRNMTRDYPFNTEGGEDMTSCQYKLRSVQGAAAELKLHGARISTIVVPGVNGIPPTSAYYTGSPWPAACADNGNCELSAPYGGERGSWGAWYMDNATNTLVREYSAGQPLACQMHVRPHVPVVSKPALINAMSVHQWDPSDYKGAIAIAMCPMPKCLLPYHVNLTVVDWCEGRELGDWNSTKACVYQAKNAFCDHRMAGGRSDACYSTAVVDTFATSVVDNKSALNTTITCTPTGCSGSSRMFRIVCKSGEPCFTYETDEGRVHDGSHNYPTSHSYPASTPSHYPAYPASTPG